MILPEAKSQAETTLTLVGVWPVRYTEYSLSLERTSDHTLQQLIRFTINRSSRFVQH